jgi:predicted Na+-dependent transporter
MDACFCSGNNFISSGFWLFSPSENCLVQEYYSTGNDGDVNTYDDGFGDRRIKISGQRQKNLLIAILINFVISPLLAFLWAKLFFKNSDPKFVAGWILKLTMPCSAMMVAWTGLAKGKTETALVIQVFSFILAIMFLPFWMTTLAHSYVTTPAFLIIKKYFLLSLFQ